MEETLPLGVGEMLIKLGRINTNVDAKHLKSFPSGVVDGSYKFKPGYTTVRLVASNDVGGSSECSFGVRILGTVGGFHFFSFLRNEFNVAIGTQVQASIMYISS